MVHGSVGELKIECYGNIDCMYCPLVNYLVNARLGWGPTASRPASPGSHTEPTYADDGSSLDPPESASVRPLTPSANNGRKWFTADIAEPLVKVLPNDWPYSGMPRLTIVLDR